jgi:hypothetical protein
MYRMIKKRNRSKQTTSLDERLARYGADLRYQAITLPSETHQAQEALKKLHQIDAARRLNASLAVSSAPAVSRGRPRVRT